MDIKHRKSYATIKLVGVKEPIVLNEGMSMVQLMATILRELSQAPNRYDKFTIDVDFSPMIEGADAMSPEQLQIAQWRADGLIPDETEEEAKLWYESPLNKNGPNFDPLFVEWSNCAVLSNRLRKLEPELKMLRDHVHAKYLGTPYYEGVTRW